MKKYNIFILLVFTFLLRDAVSQDEKLFREIFTPKLKDLVKRKSSTKNYKWQSFSPFYRLDLNSDGRDEGFLVEKQDGKNFVHIIDKGKKLIGSFELDTVGDDSKVYKINVKKLGPQTILAIIYFYEGKNDYISFNGTARVYFVTVNKSLTKSYIYKGPVIWEEGYDGREYYHQKKYKVALHDYNKDGVKEILVKQNITSHVYMYLGDGKWTTN